MIRITGGEWRGRKLRAPAGLATRPTPSRVREALFSILGPASAWGEFFDLYAGSGVVGFEALSRGAARACFVESSRAALASVDANRELLRCEARSRVVSQKLPGWLSYADFSPAWPVVFFLDPPYLKGLAGPAIEALAAATGDAPANAAGSMCVAQTEKKVDLADAYGRWVSRKRYLYGDTALWLYDLK